MIQTIEERQIARLGRSVSLPVPSYSIILCNHEEELTSLGEWVNKIARDQRVAKRTSFSIDLCLAEIVANCIEHGFPDQEQYPIYVRAEFHPNVVRLITIDGGIAFNPLERAHVELPDTLENAPIGGFGICILRHYTLMIRYQRLEGHNLLELHVPLDRSKESRGEQPVRAYSGAAEDRAFLGAGAS